MAEFVHIWPKLG